MPSLLHPELKSHQVLHSEVRAFQTTTGWICLPEASSILLHLTGNVSSHVGREQDFSKLYFGNFNYGNAERALASAK